MRSHLGTTIQPSPRLSRRANCWHPGDGTTARTTCGPSSTASRRTSSKGPERTHGQRPQSAHPSGARHRQNLRLNRALWLLAEGMRQLKA